MKAVLQLGTEEGQGGRCRAGGVLQHLVSLLWQLQEHMEEGAGENSERTGEGGEE